MSTVIIITVSVAAGFLVAGALVGLGLLRQK